MFLTKKDVIGDVREVNFLTNITTKDACFVHLDCFLTRKYMKTLKESSNEGNLLGYHKVMPIPYNIFGIFKT